jgi:two-component system capsular synthesis sensor histidine kinase RcsC
MPVDAAPIRQLARRSMRLHALLVGVVALATLQAGLILSTTLQLLGQEQERIEFHFRRLAGAIEAQEQFQRRWRMQDHALMPFTRTVPLTSRPLPALAPVQGSIGGKTQGYIPFALLHDKAVPSPSAWTLGTRLANFYGAFWADSLFPSPRCLLVNGAGTVGVLVPWTVEDVDAASASAAPLQPVVGYVHSIAGSASLQRGDIHWFPRVMRPGDRRMLSIAQSPHDAAAWNDPDDAAPPAIACLLDVDRLDDHRHVLGEPIYDTLSIINPQGRLMYGPAVDDAERRTRRLTRDGLVYRMRTASGWEAEYRVAWSRVLSQPRGPLICSAIAALLLALGGIVVLRGYRRSVLVPLREQHERLLESEAFSRTMLDAAPIGLCLLHAGDGSVLLENAVARSWLGERHDAPGWQGSWRDEALARTSTQHPAGLFCSTPDGRRLLVTATPTRFRGEPVVLCLFIDLTAQHEAEQVLEQARNTADQASRAKSVFLATMSHEIRTPLYGVLGTLELLGLTPLDGRQQEYVGAIQRSSTTLMQLISDILDVSKAEAGQLTLEPVTFCPAELTEEVLRSYAGVATRKGLQLYGLVEDGLPTVVEGDATRIRQVLNNLVSNAIKFTEGGRVVVRVRALAIDGLGVRLGWQVTDTGIGIALEHQARLFDPFYQANPGVDTVRGTGLGLAISAHLVQLMGGQLRVVSEVGLGSSFNAEVPLQRCPGSDVQRPRFASAMPVLVRSPARELADNLCDRLRERGAAAQTYHQEAARNHPTDTALLDVTLDEPREAWAGPHVIARTDGGDHPEQIEGEWVVSMHNLNAMVEALLLANGANPTPLMPAPGLSLRGLGLDILVAEDNPINQMILREQLEQLGCQAVVASDGDEALGYWAQRRFDVVLTDINMPHVDGYELTRRLRAQGHLVPVIGATANAAPEERDRCLAVGMAGCLVKPISLQALYAALSSAIGDDTAPADASVVPDAQPQVPTDSIVVPPHLRALFLGTMRSDLHALETAIDNVQPDQVRQMLHRIRGALVMVSAHRLVEQAHRIEEDIAAGATLDDRHAACEAFTTQLERALVRLERAPAESPDVH